MAKGPCARLGYNVAAFIFIPGLILIVVLAIVGSTKKSIDVNLAVEIIGCSFAGFLIWGIVWNCISIDVYATWPFSLFWRDWTLRPRGFGWRISTKIPVCRDSCMTNKLCSKCTKLVQKSNLISGSRWIYTRRVEWHDLHDSFLGLQKSMGEFCHLCSILWASIPETNWPTQHNLEEFSSQRFARVGPSPLRLSHSTALEPQSGIQGNEALRLKVWEEPKGRWYDHEHKRYLQLYQGQNTLGCSVSMHDSYLHEAPLELGMSTASNVCLELAKNWLKDCDVGHKHCKPPISTYQFLPTRLIYVGGNADSNELRLHLTSPNETNIRYLALSHCWGGFISCMLTIDNYDQMLSHIEYSDLARNFQDTITITRKLGFAYVWIDSLCIIQQSQNDWQLEAPKMASVYAQASCTISSCGSSSSDGGCFHDRNPLPYFSCSLLSKGNHSVSIKLGELVDKTNIFASEVINSPLSKRSWAFQERLLSRRILHFGSAFLFFECNTLYASERKPRGMTYKALRTLKRDGTEYDASELTQRENMGRQYFPDRHRYRATVGKHARYQAKARARNRRRNPLYQPPHVVAELFDDAVFGYRGAFENLALQSSTVVTRRQQLRLHQRWYELVSMYTSGKLTRSTDRLMGISGIAKTIQNQRGLEYLGGLWKHRLVFDLLWSLQEKAKRKPSTYRAPSWSWAAVDGRVGQSLLPFTEENENKTVDVEVVAKVCEVLLISSGKPTTSATALIDGGILDLECRLLDGLHEKFFKPSQSGDRSGPSKIERNDNSTSLTFTPDFERHNSTTTYSGQASPSDDLVDSPNPEELFCAEILKLEIPKFRGQNEMRVVHGLVLRRKGDGAGPGAPAEYERIGKFFRDTRKPQAYIGGPQLATSEDIFERAPLTRIRIV